MTSPAPDPRKQRPFFGVAAAAAAFVIALLTSLDVNGPVLIISSVLCGIIALVAAVAHLMPATRGRRVIAWCALNTCVAIPLAAGLATRSEQSAGPQAIAGNALSDAKIVGSIEGCDQHQCTVLKRATLGTPQGPVLVVAVQRNDASAFAVSSSVLVFGDAGALLWNRAFTPGYGMVDLDTDVTGNIFVRFAVTNHSTLAWVLNVASVPVNDFGTVTGELSVDGYSAVPRPCRQALREHRWHRRLAWG